MSQWLIYAGRGEPHDRITSLPSPPPWRAFDGGPPLGCPRGDVKNLEGAKAYRPESETIELVNAALLLRRPLLVTGRPGTGKSTLADAVAHELRLGPVLHWPITSRVTLRDGLYQYDPLTRLYAASRKSKTEDVADDVGGYLRLGPLGTALLPYERPRVLLIDEIDKSDIDLPNDLLTVFEKGEYEIAELVRVAHTQKEAEVMVADGADSERVTITSGLVRCRAFPLVVMTSNGEREFPPAFLRRCITVRLDQPDEGQLTQIVRAHLGDLADKSDDLISQFFARRSSGELATDQLLNAIYLIHQAERSGRVDRRALADKVMPYLSTLSDPDDDLPSS
jgi:MoxR-like ATPase